MTNPIGGNEQVNSHANSKCSQGSVERLDLVNQGDLIKWIIGAGHERVPPRVRRR